MKRAPPTKEGSGPIGAWWRGWRQPQRRISLALQGGGAHGAFTWGVLDALLEDPRVHFDGISGSSAGAMNAVVLASGWIGGGREGAREALNDFWTALGKQMPAAMVTQGAGDDIGLSAAAKWLANWAGHFSPAQLNPFDLNPLRDLIASRIDFERLRAACPFKLFVAATQADTGRLRVFRERELTQEMLLASACLPRIHHAVEIDGEPYWDGGYSANPAVFPLFYDCVSSDVLLVLLSPLEREATPRTVEEIDARIVELAFSAPFMREMRTFSQAREFARGGFVAMGRLERRLRSLRFHMIDNSHLPALERTDTKLLAHGPFLERLRDQGRERAGAWLDEHFEQVGRASTLDVKKWFG
ncbi:MAG: patatin-like phospholipase family protein [Burkholderiales bacterium]|nr:patatin-like phospholipase family protein [Burkholderiales bacterium]MDE2452218.1 patatin-like phospholipase family protein [Burkholderiales bacterium]